MNRNLTVLGLIMLTGCSLSEEKFAAQSAEKACSLYEECGYIEYFGGTYDACVTQMEAATLAYVNSADCEYDGSAAKACLSEWDDVTCEGTTETGETDSACDDICGSSADGGTTPAE